MAEQTFGTRRCRDSRKPLEKQCPDVVFYRCQVCGALFPVTGGLALEPKEIICCGKQAENLITVDKTQVTDRMTLEYQIIGGYNDNAVRVTWNSTAGKNAPEWIYLKTFTGGYLKYVSETKRSPMVFALADTDAFAYCDEDPCLECVFRCKRGFIIYAYIGGAEVVEIPLDRMNAHWQSDSKQ